MTAAKRDRLGKAGAALIERNVRTINIKAVVQALRDEDKYVQESILPRYRKILPPDQLP